MSGGLTVCLTTAPAHVPNGQAQLKLSKQQQQQTTATTTSTTTMRAIDRLTERFSHSKNL